jgi:hypothetical protein
MMSDSELLHVPYLFPRCNRIFPTLWRDFIERLDRLIELEVLAILGPLMPYAWSVR